MSQQVYFFVINYVLFSSALIALSLLRGILDQKFSKVGWWRRPVEALVLTMALSAFIFTVYMAGCGLNNSQERDITDFCIFIIGFTSFVLSAFTLWGLIITPFIRTEDMMEMWKKI